MKEKKKTKEEKELKEENLNEVSGGGTTVNETIYNSYYEGEENFIFKNGSFEQIRGIINQFDSSGKLDYLKKK